MRFQIKFWIALLLLVVVVAVCISPAVDLEPTALRSVRVANLMFAALALIVLSVGLNRVMRLAHAAVGLWPLALTTDGILELNCSRLC